MNKIVYYVAISVDGFIAGEDEDISGFLQEGNAIQKYLDDLQSYKTVIMGRKTYEFGYKYGLKPGDLAYPNMNHYIFSSSLEFEKAHSNVHVRELDLQEVKTIRDNSETDVYLCGGGRFAGWLLENEMIDIVKLKVNPFVMGNGIPIFQGVAKYFQLDLFDTHLFDHGLLINSYNIKY